MSEPDLTVVLPCAGEGKRLGLDRPKELFELVPGLPMIQFSLDLILFERTQARKNDCRIRVVTVIREGKESVYEYVRAYLPSAHYDVRSVYFDSNLQEWPGSIYSARDHFSEKNIVLLPDSFLRVGKLSKYLLDKVTSQGSETLLQSLSEELDQYPFVAALKRSDDADEITKLGAVNWDLGSGEMIDWRDKPESGEGFNAIWGSIGFRKGIAEELHGFLMSSVAHHPKPFSDCSFYPGKGIAIADYLDLGTWERIKSFRGESVD